MNPYINIGLINIRIYSICILIGIILAYFIITNEGKKHGFKKEELSDLIFYVVIFGIIGARAYYCIFNMDYYAKNILSIFKIWEGGLAIHGGIIFGLITIITICHKKKYNLFIILDLFALGLIIAQSIGRWGNFFNREAHGGITTLSYLKGLYLPNFIIKGMYIDGNYYIPTFLFESLWCLLGFIIMFTFKNKKFTKVGLLTGFYCIWYGIERFFIEMFRTDSLMLFDFKIAQIISILMFIIGILIIIKNYKKDVCYSTYMEGEKYE